MTSYMLLKTYTSMDYKDKLEHINTITSIRNTIVPSSHIKKIKVKEKVISHFNIIDAGRLVDSFTDIDTYIFTIRDNGDFDFDNFILMFKKAKKKMVILVNMLKETHYFDDLKVSVYNSFPFFDIYFYDDDGNNYWILYTEMV